MIKVGYLTTHGAYKKTVASVEEAKKLIDEWLNPDTKMIEYEFPAEDIAEHNNQQQGSQSLIAVTQYWRPSDVVKMEIHEVSSLQIASAIRGEGGKVLSLQ